MVLGSGALSPCTHTLITCGKSKHRQLVDPTQHYLLYRPAKQLCQVMQASGWGGASGVVAPRSTRQARYQECVMGAGQLGKEQLRQQGGHQRSKRHPGAPAKQPRPLMFWTLLSNLFGTAVTVSLLAEQHHARHTQAW